MCSLNVIIGLSILFYPKEAFLWIIKNMNPMKLFCYIKNFFPSCNLISTIYLSSSTATILYPHIFPLFRLDLLLRIVDSVVCNFLASIASDSSTQWGNSNWSAVTAIHSIVSLILPNKIHPPTPRTLIPSACVYYSFKPLAATSAPLATVVLVSKDNSTVCCHKYHLPLTFFFLFFFVPL